MKTKTILIIFLALSMATLTSFDLAREAEAVKLVEAQTGMPMVCYFYCIGEGRGCCTYSGGIRGSKYYDGTCNCLCNNGDLCSIPPEYFEEDINWY